MSKFATSSTILSGGARNTREMQTSRSSGGRNSSSGRRWRVVIGSASCGESTCSFAARRQERQRPTPRPASPRTVTDPRSVDCPEGGTGGGRRRASLERRAGAARRLLREVVTTATDNRDYWINPRREVAALFDAFGVRGCADGDVGLEAGAKASPTFASDATNQGITARSPCPSIRCRLAAHDRGIEDEGRPDELEHVEGEVAADDPDGQGQQSRGVVAPRPRAGLGGGDVGVVRRARPSTTFQAMTRAMKAIGATSRRHRDKQSASSHTVELMVATALWWSVPRSSADFHLGTKSHGRLTSAHGQQRPPAAEAPWQRHAGLVQPAGVGHRADRLTDGCMTRS